MFFAFSEMRRSVGRFLLLAGAVGLLILLLLFFQAVAGTLVRSLTGAVEQQSADVLVYDARSRLNPSASVLAPAAVEQVAGVAGVQAAGPVSLTVATGRPAGGEDLDVALWGFDPEGPGAPTTLVEGRLPDASGEAVFSASSFDDALTVGDDLTVAGQEVKIVGVADDAAFNVLPTLYTTVPTYESVVQARAGGAPEVPISLVAVTVADGAAPEVVAADIEAGVGGVQALDRAAAVDALPGVSTITQSFSILYVLLFIVVTIVTAVFFLILTVQKRDALVLLRAVGARRRDIVAPVVWQVLVVVGAGVGVGTALAAGLLAAARDTFGAALDGSTTLLSAAAVLALALVGSAAAIRRVLAIQPVEATRTGGID